MNCHGNHGDSDNRKGQHKSHQGHLSHMLMMALCCGAPILILLIVPLLIKNGGSGIAKVLTALAPFLCPLMMLFMMPMMFRDRKDKAEKDNSQSNKQEYLEEASRE